MKRQCECQNQADETMFGPQHRCEPPPVTPPIPAGSLVASWRFVVPAEEPVLRDRWDMDDDERSGR